MSVTNVTINVNHVTWVVSDNDSDYVALNVSYVACNVGIYEGTIMMCHGS